MSLRGVAGEEWKLMEWQELFFIVGNFAQVFMLLPMLLSESKPPLKSSVPLTITLAGFTYAFFSLGLVLSGIAMGAVTVAWGALAFQAAVGIQFMSWRPKSFKNYWRLPVGSSRTLLIWRRW